MISRVNDWTYDKLLFCGIDLGDLGPRERHFRVELVVRAVEVNAEGIDAEDGIASLGIDYVEVVDAEHLEVLRNLEVLEHCLFCVLAAVLLVEGGYLHGSRSKSVLGLSI